MTKYDSMRKKERNDEIRAYAKKHPDHSQQEIADHFADKYGISRPTISLILNNKLS